MTFTAFNLDQWFWVTLYFTWSGKVEIGKIKRCGDHFLVRETSNHVLPKLELHCRVPPTTHLLKWESQVWMNFRGKWEGEERKWDCLVFKPANVLSKLYWVKTALDSLAIDLDMSLFGPSCNIDFMIYIKFYHHFIISDLLLNWLMFVNEETVMLLMMRIHIIKLICWKYLRVWGFKTLTWHEGAIKSNAKLMCMSKEKNMNTLIGFWQVNHVLTQTNLKTTN